MKTSFLGVSTVLFLFCLAAPAQAQYCEQDCAPGYGGLGYPMCDQRCNAGGGDYSQTCGSMGYDCCTNAIVVVDVLGETAHRIHPWVPFYCEVEAWVNLQNIVYCPDQTYYGGGTWCAQIGSGVAFTSEPYADCCDTGACWGQTWC